MTFLIAARSPEMKESVLRLVHLPKRNRFFPPWSLLVIFPRNNLFVLLSNRTAEFIAASLPETRPQENLLGKKPDLLDLPFFVRSYLRSLSSARETEYRKRRRE